MNFHISASQIITEGFWEEGGVVWWCQKNVLTCVVWKGDVVNPSDH